MPRLNVRCCCQPQKILGTLDVASPIGGNLVQKVHVTLTHRVAESPKPAWPAIIITSNQYETIELRLFFMFDEHGASTEEWAIYSDDRPLEFWRKLNGFQESLA